MQFMARGHGLHIHSVLVLHLVIIDIFSKIVASAFSGHPVFWAKADAKVLQIFELTKFYCIFFALFFRFFCKVLKMCYLIFWPFWAVFGVLCEESIKKPLSGRKRLNAREYIIGTRACVRMCVYRVISPQQEQLPQQVLPLRER